MGGVQIDGYVEAVTDAAVDYDGEEFQVHGPDDSGALGSVFTADSPLVTAHPELFRPLVITVQD